ncbi:MAG: DoxX family protein [Tidjanibacter sp.]|nr:DoxX family protein [Tidjanibacter sp.]
MSKITKYILAHGWTEWVARVVIGVVFIFSSAVKAIDPYGTVLKMDEYFVAMGLEWLSGAGVVLAVGLIALEMLLGVALLLRAWPRLMAWAAVVFNGFYLLLTLWVAVADPVAECGCFGDVVILSNWQTFGKNVVLTLLTLPILWRRKESSGRAWSTVATLVLTALTLAFAIYSLIKLPVVEKFPFGVGVNLPEAIEEDLVGAADQSVVVCRNLQTGQMTEFASDDSTWWNEQEWEFVELKTTKTQAKVRASEFVLHSGGYNLTPQLMLVPMCRLLCAERLDRLSLEEQRKMRMIAKDCLSRGNRVVVVTSSPLIEAQTMFPELEFCNMDPVVLRALLRAPAGMVSVSKGTIIHKASLWALGVEE